jgi:hypothetical protein
MNGNGKVEGLLERIATSVERTEETQERMAVALGDLAAAQARQGDEMVRSREKLAGIRRDMNRGFAQVNARVDHVLEIAGRHHNDHEERLQILDQHVLGKTSG